MAENYLITGYWGEPHVTAENDRGINAAMFGAGRFVLPVGERFRAEYIGNNTVRMYDGKLLNNGAAAGIPAGESIDLLIPSAGQGKKRCDVIAFQYSKDASTMIESGNFVVIQGEETEGEPEPPELTQNDLLSGDATFDQMALYTVYVDGFSDFTLQKEFSMSNIELAIAFDDSGYAKLKFIAGDTKEAHGDIAGLRAGNSFRTRIKQFSKSAKDDGSKYFEEFRFPVTPAALTDDYIFEILTSKKPVTIEQGGTGATTATDAKANLGIGITRLWANAAPYSSFAKQTINLPYGEYDAYLITFGYSTNLGFEMSSIVKFLARNGTNGFGHFKNGDYGDAEAPSEVWRAYSIWRKQSTQEHGIQFCGGYANGGANNTVCIPWTVWGINW